MNALPPQGCTRCFLLLTKHDPVLLDQALARLAPPLLTLVTTSCVELAYPVLQHILLILETGEVMQISSRFDEHIPQWRNVSSLPVVQVGQ